jgi:hypothetical protein
MNQFPSLLELLAEYSNWNYWRLYMAPTCHICVKTGIRECDPEAAEIKCLICNFCNTERQRKERENGSSPAR